VVGNLRPATESHAPTCRPLLALRDLLMRRQIPINLCRPTLVGKDLAPPLLAELPLRSADLAGPVNVLPLTTKGAGYAVACGP
jgi:hypothetical protein